MNAQYRYPGIRSFKDENLDRSLFFGRTEDTSELLNKVLAEKLVVLYGKSGVGKSSLLQASLSEKLRRNNCIPLFIRFHDYKIDPSTRLLDEVTRLHSEYIRDVPKDLRDYCVTGTRKYKSYESEKNAEDNTKKQVWDFWLFFKTIEFWKKGHISRLENFYQESILLTPVLILDQFEEVFRHHDNFNKKEFFKNISLITNKLYYSVSAEKRDLLTYNRFSTSETKSIGYETFNQRSPNVKVLISIRGDYLGLLEEVADEIPDIFVNYFRLKPLTADKSTESITRPGEVSHSSLRTRPFSYNNDAVTLINNFLLSNSNSLSGGINTNELQLLCHHIEKNIVLKKQKEKPGCRITISEENLGGKSGLSRILKNYIASCISKYTFFTQWRIHRTLKTNFIGKDGKTRNPMTRDQIGLKDKYLDELENNRILRNYGDKGELYEITHDTLVQPILKAAHDQTKRFWKKLELFSLFVLGIIALVLFFNKDYLSSSWNNNLANKAQAKGDFTDAKRKYMISLERNPKNFESYYEYQNLLVLEEDYIEAIEMFKMAINNFDSLSILSKDNSAEFIYNTFDSYLGDYKDSKEDSLRNEAYDFHQFYARNVDSEKVDVENGLYALIGNKMAQLLIEGGFIDESTSIYEELIHSKKIQSSLINRNFSRLLYDKVVNRGLERQEQDNLLAQLNSLDSNVYSSLSKIIIEEKRGVNSNNLIGKYKQLQTEDSYSKKEKSLVYYHYGKLLEKMDRISEAVNKLDTARILNSEDENILIAHTDLDNLHKAIYNVDSTTTQNIKSIPHTDLRTIFLWYIERGRFDRVDDYLKLLKTKYISNQSSSYKEIILDLYYDYIGEKSVFEGHFSKAIKYYEQIESISYYSLGNLAWCYYSLAIAEKSINQEHLRESIEISYKALELGGDYYWVMGNLALAYLHNTSYNLDSVRKMYRKIYDLLRCDCGKEIRSYSYNKPQILQKRAIEDVENVIGKEYYQGEIKNRVDTVLADLKGWEENLQEAMKQTTSLNKSDSKSCCTECNVKPDYCLSDD